MEQSYFYNMCILLSFGMHADLSVVDRSTTMSYFAGWYEGRLQTGVTHSRRINYTLNVCLATRCSCSDIVKLPLHCINCYGDVLEIESLIFLWNEIFIGALVLFTIYIFTINIIWSMYVQYVFYCLLYVPYPFLSNL